MNFDLAFDVEEKMKASLVRRDLDRPVKISRREYEEGIMRMTNALIHEDGMDPSTARQRAKDYWDNKCPKFAANA